jgi:hypothetical protein
MNELGTGIILCAALGLAALIAVRLHRAGVLPLPPAAGSPPGTSTVALGQWAVAPDRQWLLIQPGQ